MATRPDCDACGRPVAVDHEPHYKKVEGWVKARKRGANEVALRKDLGAYMHFDCMSLLKRGVLPGQVAIDMKEEGQLAFE